MQEAVQLFIDDFQHVGCLPGCSMIWGGVLQSQNLSLMTQTVRRMYSVHTASPSGTVFEWITAKVAVHMVAIPAPQAASKVRRGM